MIKKCFFLLISFYVLQMILSPVPPRKNFDNRPTKVYRVDLSLSIKDRYEQILLDHKIAIRSLIVNIYKLKPAMKYFSYIFNIFKHNQDPDFLAHTEVFAEILEVSSLDIAIMQFIDQFTCTSIIVQNSENEVFFSRNFDYPLYSTLYDLGIQVDYYQGDTFLFKANTIAGLIGLLNSMKPGKFAASINSRKNNLYLNSLRILAGYYPPEYFILKSTIQANSFKEMYGLLTETKFNMNVYFILCGLRKTKG